MDAGFALHMLPEELDPHVHQLGGVQGGAAIPGVSGGVGRDPGEAVNELKAGGVGAGGDLVGVAGVPGEGGVQGLEHTVPGHECLTGAALLTGTTIEDHGAVKLSRGDGLLDGQGGAQRGGAQQIVPAAVAAGILGGEGSALGAGGLLREAVQSVKLTQQTNDGPS